jgi:hypothetical protein
LEITRVESSRLVQTTNNKRFYDGIKYIATRLCFEAARAGQNNPNAPKAIEGQSRGLRDDITISAKTGTTVAGKLAVWSLLVVLKARIAWVWNIHLDYSVCPGAGWCAPQTPETIWKEL